MTVTPYPEPGVTTGPAWAQMNNEAIESRYQDALTRIEEASEIEQKRTGTLAYSEKTTGTAGLVTTITTSGVEVAGMILTVEPTDADVWLKWGASPGISVVGAGFLSLRLVEVFDAGTFTYLKAPINRQYAAGVVTAFADTFDSEHRIGPVEATRQFYLSAVLFREAGSSLAAYLCDSYNNGAGAELAKTWMAAVAQ